MYYLNIISENAIKSIVEDEIFRIFCPPRIDATFKT